MATAPYAGGNTARPIDLYLTDESGVAVGITAFAGGGQGSATLLTKTNNSVDTVATAADSVKLPLATVGARIRVFNTTATSAQVFGSGTDTINAVATATGVALAAGKNAEFVGIVAGTTSPAVAGKWRMILSA
jgi:hypothetical protein